MTITSMNHQIDLESLLESCSDARARVYIKEAIDCYRVGAYRSAIVATWIAVVYNIIDKLREIGIAGDAVAAAQVKKFEDITQNRDIEEALKFERSILGAIQTPYEFITAQEAVELGRLQEDRNRCAHPNLFRDDEVFTPTPEQARMHIRNAVEIMLARPPVQGMAALTFLQHQVDSEYFPTDGKAAYEALKASPVYRAKRNLIKSFILGAISSCIKEQLPYKKRLQRVAAVSAILKLHPDVAPAIVKEGFEVICHKLHDDDLAGLVLVLHDLPDLQSWMSTQSGDRLRRYVSNMPSDDVAIALVHAISTEMTAGDAVSRLASITDDELSAAINTCKEQSIAILPRFIERAIEYYKDSGNYDTANRRAGLLITPCIPQATEGQLLDIIRAGQNSQVKDSHQFSSVLVACTQQRKIGIPALRAVLTELNLLESNRYLVDTKGA